MAKIGKETRPASYDKLIAELKRRDVKPAEACKQMGYSSAGFTGIKRDGRIAQRLMRALETNYGITYDNIKPDEEQTAAEPKQLTIAPEPIEARLIVDDEARKALYTIILDALLDANLVLGTSNQNKERG